MSIDVQSLAEPAASVNITNLSKGWRKVVFDHPGLCSSAGKKLEITIFSDYKIRKVPNFTSNMVGFGRLKI